MKRRDTKTDSPPPHDYELALQTAVSWLGDRYLLAEPQPRRADQTLRLWNEARIRHAALARRSPSQTRH